MHRARAVVVLVLLALVTPACKRLVTGAREEFAKKFSCPEDRVQVAERKDLSAYELIFGKMEAEKPPEAVLDDPERLAKWKADHDKSESKKRWDASFAVFEASGCDHKALLACAHPGGSKGGQRLNAVSCSIYEVKDGDEAGGSVSEKKKRKKDD